jgi:predicted RNA-binding protein with PUA-like domain
MLRAAVHFRGGQPRGAGWRPQLQERNYIRAMKPGEIVLFYHSGDDKSVVGAMKILSEARPDRTAGEEGWSAIDLAPAWGLKSPVTLASIKAVPSLKDIYLVRVARLSVMPLEKAAFDRIVAMGGGTTVL